MAFINTWRSCNFFFSVEFLKTKRLCFNKIFSLNFQARTLGKMNVAYFQHFKDEERVLIKVNLKDEYINRSICFERKFYENVEVFLQRLDNKITDLLQRKTKKKKKKEKSGNELNLPENFSQKHSCLLLNNEQLPSELKFQDIFENINNDKIKLRILDVDYDVLINFPMVVNMTLPKQIRIGTLLIPEKFVVQFTDIINSEYIWHKSLTPLKIGSWEKCGEGKLYYVKENDENYFLKLVCIPKRGKKVGPSFDAVSTTAVEGFLDYEEIRKRHNFTKEKTKFNEFRVVSYNILADVYTKTKEAKEELFVFCDPAYLDCNYRRNLLNFELFGYNADIICLQEVDIKFYQNNLNFLFSNMDYNCIFNEKKGTTEGCLFIYHKNKFNFFKTHQYEISQELLSNPLLNDIRVKIQNNEKLMQRLAIIPTQIQISVLESFSKHILVIGNTHFYFHPNADHIRLLQGIISFRLLLKTVEEIKEQDPRKKISVILCGDFNSTPECGFHQLLNTGLINNNHIDWKSKEDEAIENLDFHHNVKMKSAYENNQYTNYTPIFKGCLDYIYYQTDHLEVKQTVPIPSEDVLGKCSGIPSEFFPSDHIALVVDFKFKEEK